MKTGNRLLTVLVALVLMAAWALDAPAQQVPLISKDELRSPAYGKGQLPVEHGEVTYTKVVAVEDASADDLMSRAVHALNSLSPKHVKRITMQDNTNRILQVDGSYAWCYSKRVGIKYTYYHTVTFDLRIECREGRYRMTLDNMWDFDENGASTDPSLPRYADDSLLDSDGLLKLSNDSYIRAGVIKAKDEMFSMVESWMKRPVQSKKTITGEGDDW